MLQAARSKYRTQNSRQNRHVSTIAQLCPATSSQLRHASTTGKSLLNSNVLRMFSQYSELRPTSSWDLLESLGHPYEFQRVSRLDSVLYGTPAVGVSQTATLNRRRHLYLAGRPPRWALAHVLVLHSITNNVIGYVRWHNVSVWLDAWIMIVIHCFLVTICICHIIFLIHLLETCTQ